MHEIVKPTLIAWAKHRTNNEINWKKMNFLLSFKCTLKADSRFYGSGIKWGLLLFYCRARDVKANQQQKIPIKQLIL